MKPNPFLLLLFCTLGWTISAFASSDTTYFYYDGSWNITTVDKAFYVGKLWPENGRYKKRDYYKHTGKLQMEGFYADKELQVQDGPFEWYYPNGRLSATGSFLQGKRNGLEQAYNYRGKLVRQIKWNNDIPVDTAWSRSWPFEIDYWQVTDSAGNGYYEAKWAKGKKLAVKGELKKGKKENIELHYDPQEKLIAKAHYEQDSLISIECFDASGKAIAEQKCILEQQAMYGSNEAAWRAYIQKGLRYPKSARADEAQGIVTLFFWVEPDGTISEITVLASPHQALSEEAIRVIEKSGKWQPAIFNNQPMRFPFIQNVSFRLE